MAPRRGSKRTQQHQDRARAETSAGGSAQPRQQARGARSRRCSDALGSSGKKAAARPQTVEISAAHLLKAIESLYGDELKPVGRILRKRVAELWPTMEGSGVQCATPNLAVEQLRNLCHANPSLTIENEEGGDFSALLLGREQSFVDIYNANDSYSSEMWTGLRAFCESTCGQKMSLPGGRFACAQALADLHLPCLAGYSLGRICHIVQLAITQKNILGYMNGAVVAWSNSQSKVKKQLASEGHPLTATGQGEEMLPVASLREAQTCMQQILRDASGKIPLSNVKRSFRSKFELELSETSLGHSKLSELLNSTDFNGICAVELRDTGYVVVETKLERILQGAPCQTSSYLDGTPLDKVDTGDIQSPKVLASPICEPYYNFIGNAPHVQRTFIQYDWPRTPVAGSRSRSCSVPKDMSFGQSWFEIFGGVEKFGGRTSRQSTAASSGFACDDASSASWSDVDQNESELVIAEEHGSDTLSRESTMPNVSSWVDEPLRFEDPDDTADSESLHGSASFDKWHLFTPGMLAKQGCKVQNTFFHVAPPLPTPVRTGAMHRSKSVPKEIGCTNIDLQHTDGVRSSTTPTVQSPPLASPSVYWPPTPAAPDFLQNQHTDGMSSISSPMVQSPPLASPSAYWPPTPAEPDFSQNAFSWASAGFDAFEPTSLAPTCQFLQCPAPAALHQNIFYITQHI